MNLPERHDVTVITHKEEYVRRLLYKYLAVCEYTSTLLDGGDGAQGRDRTTDTAIFSRMLYQLSYLGISATGRNVRRRELERAL